MQESNSLRPSRARRFDIAPFQSQSAGWRNCCFAIFTQAKSRTLEKKAAIAGGAGEIAHPRCNLTEHDYSLPNRARSRGQGRALVGGFRSEAGRGRGETTLQLEVK
jgi:hypothetical protein